MSLQLTPQENEVYNRIYLRILMQIAIEKMDDLKGTQAYQGPLRVKMNDLYQMLDKSTKMYDELFRASATGTTEFYKMVSENVEMMMQYSLPQASIINNMLAAYLKDEKSITGIVKKVLKSPEKQNPNSTF